jgi:N-acyl homoserine lactone hydrolase
LKKIGLAPDDIKYVVVSHMHLNHAGNIAKSPNSTIVIQRKELLYGFWPDEPCTGPFISGNAAVLRSGTGAGKPNAFNMLILDDEDRDLFNDASVIVKNARGHTAGHQMMLIRLPNIGPTIPTGDNVCFRENVEKSIPPSLVLAYDPAAIMRAYEYIRYMKPSEGADFFTSHDPQAYKARKKAPQYYD